MFRGLLPQNGVSPRFTEPTLHFRTPELPNFRTSPTPDSASRRGATLLITLGILTVLSVIAVAFFSVSRIQRQTATAQQYRDTARDQLPEALHLAIATIDASMSATNIIDNPSAFEPNQIAAIGQRLAPFALWFSTNYYPISTASPANIHEHQNLCFSVGTNNPPQTVNLLTPSVLRTLPPVLTNTLDLYQTTPEQYRSEWIGLTDFFPNEVQQILPFPRTQSRIAYAIINVSGFIDANYFINGPSQQRSPRAIFTQSDVTNWLTTASDSPYWPDGLANIPTFDASPDADPAEHPFWCLSYDRGPDIIPFANIFTNTAAEHAGTLPPLTVNPNLGSLLFISGYIYAIKNSIPLPILNDNSPIFDASSIIDINRHHMIEFIQELAKNDERLKLLAYAPLTKFNLHSITNQTDGFNIYQSGTGADDTRLWYNSQAFKELWLDPVTNIVSHIARTEPDENIRMSPTAFAWNLANLIDPNAIPELTTFERDENGLNIIPSRTPYATDNTPLINKITVFNIFDDNDEEFHRPEEAPPEDSYPLNPICELDPSLTPSNHYAMAVELWYPFSPAPLPPNASFFAHMFTNAADVITSTNRPWTADLLEQYLFWQSPSNSVMQTLFYAWANAYTNAVGPTVWHHPLWQTVTTNASVWFTPDMSNTTVNASWPTNDANGRIDITTSPIWQAFHPDPSEFPILHWPDPDGTTNRLAYIGRDGDTNSLPVIIWENETTGALTTNRVVTYTDSDGNTLDFTVPTNTAAFHANWDALDTNTVAFADMTNDLQVAPLLFLAFGGNPDDLIRFYDAIPRPATNNVVDGSDFTDRVYTVSLLTPDGTPFTLSSTNLVATGSIIPLPMPPALGTTAYALLSLLIPFDTSPDLYDFLMLTPDKFPFDMLTDLFAGGGFDNIFSQMLPLRVPTLGKMTEENRFRLTDDDGEVILGTEDGAKIITVEDPVSGGFFWTIYPTQTVSFVTFDPEIVQGAEGASSYTIVHTNFNALGATSSENTTFTIWLQNAATLDRNANAAPNHPAPVSPLDQAEVIVDEALLLPPFDVPAESPEVFPIQETVRLYTPDPRRNAYAVVGTDMEKSTTTDYTRDWWPMNTEWEEPDIRSTTVTDVTELPFQHFNTPLSSIGDIGHIYASRIPSAPSRNRAYPAILRDTFSFVTRSEASLLDFFTLRTGNPPMYGLVQPNTSIRPVIEALFGQSVTNAGTVTQLADAYQDALTSVQPILPTNVDPLPENSIVGMGWRSFADMLPSISTNDFLNGALLTPDNAPAHDWIEDALRRLPDKVSFRQNIFVIVIAAQTLSPASTAERPVVLADQRAAVTVIRDAFTGRWVIHSWRWLTE